MAKMIDSGATFPISAPVFAIVDSMAKMIDSGAHMHILKLVELIVEHFDFHRFGLR